MCWFAHLGTDNVAVWRIELRHAKSSTENIYDTSATRPTLSIAGIVIFFRRLLPLRATAAPLYWPAHPRQSPLPARPSPAPSSAPHGRTRASANANTHALNPFPPKPPFPLKPKPTPTQLLRLLLQRPDARQRKRVRAADA